MQKIKNITKRGKVPFNTPLTSVHTFTSTEKYGMNLSRSFSRTRQTQSCAHMDVYKNIHRGTLYIEKFAIIP